jgi:hypothetical protein
MGGNPTSGPTALDIIGLLKHRLRLFLGGLWLLDGLLQMQPQMFTSNFPAQVLLPSFQSLPQPLRAFALGTLYPYIQLHEQVFNTLALLVQVALGAIILVAPKRLYGVSLVTSIVWSTLIWVFGQAFGSIFAFTGGGTLMLGTPSIYTGFPGSGLLYIYLSLILLLPDKVWENHSRKSLSPLWDFAPLLLTGVLIAQLNPNLFTASGQATIFQSNLDTNIPQALAWSVATLGGYSIASPFLANILEVIPIISLIALWLTGHRRTAFILSCVYLAFAWWFGMGLGGLLTGLGTDPNTPPLLLAISYLTLEKQVFDKRVLVENTMSAPRYN